MLLHPLVVHGPALPQQQAVSHSPDPPNVFSGDLAEALLELGLLEVGDLAVVALGAAVLTHHSADHAFRYLVMLLQDQDGPVATLRVQKFLAAPQGAPSGATRSLIIAFPSSAFFRSFLSRAFSFSSWVSLLASSACMPPYCWR